MNANAARCLFSGVGGMLACSALAAAVPRLVNYQGRLTDTAGDPVNGDVYMGVRVYDAAEAGHLLYFEDIGYVSVNEGVYSFKFGATGFGEGAVESSQLVAVTNGELLVYQAQLSTGLIPGTLAILDGVFRWSERDGSSDPKVFQVGIDSLTKIVTVAYDPKVRPESGREIVARFEQYPTERLVNVLSGMEFLALVVDGIESAPRSRLLAVPYAMFAESSETSTDAQALLAEVASLRSMMKAQGFAQGDFAVIPTGSFLMGSASQDLWHEDNEVQHWVYINRPYMLQRTEVTWEQWNAVRDWALLNGYTDLPAGRKGSHGDSGNTDRDPVTMVSWYAAVKWLNARSEMEKLAPCYTVAGAVFRTGTDNPACSFGANGYRLPTEAEWEYACRAKSTTDFHSGPLLFTGSSQVANLDLIGWYTGNSDTTGVRQQSHPVGLKSPNACGLFDMSGNVSEWCWDWYGDYPGSVYDPTGPASGTSRVGRGGAWSYDARWARSACRNLDLPTGTSAAWGFRPARTVVP